MQEDLTLTQMPESTATYTMDDLLFIDIWMLGATLIITALLFISIKWLSGFISGVNARSEIAEKDNPAFGISVASTLLAVAIMLTGVVSGERYDETTRELLLLSAYGILGVFMMSMTHYIFDKISLPKIDLRHEILDGNIAASILNAGNVIATSIIIRTIMLWVESDTFTGLILVLAGFVVSQFLLSAASFYRLKLYYLYHATDMQEALKENSAAIALRFSGHRIGVALAITAASHLIPYDEANLATMMFYWALLSFVMVFFVSTVAILAHKVILANIDVRDEVDNQRNIAVGAIQAAIYISIGLLFSNGLS